MDASIYLAIIGHYCQASALLRFALENTLMDIYYYYDPDCIAKWEQGIGKIPTGVNLIKKVFSDNGTPYYNKLIALVHKLHGFVHIKYDNLTDYIKPVFKYEDHMNWVELYCTASVLISGALIGYYPKFEESKIRWYLLQDFLGTVVSESDFKKLYKELGNWEYNEKEMT